MRPTALLATPTSAVKQLRLFVVLLSNRKVPIVLPRKATVDELLAAVQRAQKLSGSPYRCHHVQFGSKSLVRGVSLTEYLFHNDSVLQEMPDLNGGMHAAGTATQLTQLRRTSNGVLLCNTDEPAPDGSVVIAPPPSITTSGGASQDLRNVPNHLLGISIAGLVVFMAKYADNVLDQVKARKVREWEEITDYTQKVPAELFEKYSTRLSELDAEKDGGGYDVMYAMEAVGALHGRKALVEILRDDNGGCDENGAYTVGKVTHFVSWWMNYSLSAVLEMLKGYAQAAGTDCFFYLNVTALRQPATENETLPGEGFQQMLGRLFEESVAAAGHTIFLIDNFGDPGALKRAWCLWEIFHTVKAGAKFEVVMSVSQQAAFEQALVHDYDSIQILLSAINVKKATAFKEDDLRMIMDHIEEEVGFDALNQMIDGEIRGWVTTTANAALAAVPQEERATGVLINQVALLLKQQGKLDEAEPLYREALQGKRAKLGNDHPSTLNSINNLGMLLQAQGTLDEAEPLFREALQGERAKLGNDHPGTLGSIYNLADLLQAQGKLDEAEPLLRVC